MTNGGGEATTVAECLPRIEVKRALSTGRFKRHAKRSGEGATGESERETAERPDRERLMPCF